MTFNHKHSHYDTLVTKAIQSLVLFVFLQCQWLGELVFLSMIEDHTIGIIDWAMMMIVEAYIVAHVQLLRIEDHITAAAKVNNVGVTNCWPYYVWKIYNPSDLSNIATSNYWHKQHYPMGTCNVVNKHWHPDYGCYKIIHSNLWHYYWYSSSLIFTFWPSLCAALPWLGCIWSIWKN